MPNWNSHSDHGVWQVALERIKYPSIDELGLTPMNGLEGSLYTSEEELPTWLLPGSFVRRIARYPKFVNVVDEETEPWSEHVAIGDIGTIRRVDYDDNTALVEWAPGQMSWLALVELEPTALFLVTNLPNLRR